MDNGGSTGVEYMPRYHVAMGSDPVYIKGTWCERQWQYMNI